MAIDDLHEFPYEALAPYAARARAHPDGMVDLSIGNPVDPAPQVVRDAIVAATDAHAYPLIQGTPPLHDAIARWYARRRGFEGLTPATPSTCSTSPGNAAPMYSKRAGEEPRRPD